MTKILNRFGELTEELQRGYSSQVIHDQTLRRTREAFSALYDFLRVYAPKGDGSNDPYGRPSIRLHGKTLFDSWVPVEYDDPPSGFAGASVNIEFAHPTVESGRRDLLDWLLTGTPPHMVGTDRFLGTGGRKIRYHWGSPLLWPPKDGLPAGARFAFGVGNSVAMRRRGYWAQPITPNFVDLALDRAEPRIVAAFGDLGSEVAYGPLERSQFLSRR